MRARSYHIAYNGALAVSEFFTFTVLCILDCIINSL